MSETETRKRDGVKLTVLWEKIDANGRKYYVGPLTSDTGLAVFPAAKKVADTDPDAYVYILPNRKNKPS